VSGYQIIRLCSVSLLEDLIVLPDFSTEHCDKGSLIGFLFFSDLRELLFYPGCPKSIFGVQQIYGPLYYSSSFICLFLEGWGTLFEIIRFLKFYCCYV
jgi:hypothetical protein